VAASAGANMSRLSSSGVPSQAKMMALRSQEQQEGREQAQFVVDLNDT